VAAESLPRRFHVPTIDLETEIIYNGQVLQDIPWPAADVEHLLSVHGPDVIRNNRYTEGKSRRE
jgi:hypothetical protein